MIPCPFEMTVYDESMAKRGTIGAPTELTVTPRFNEVGSLQVLLPYGHPRTADLMTGTARIHCTLKGEDAAGNPWSEPMPSGAARLVRGEGIPPRGHVMFTVEDDFRLLRRVRGWPVPTSPIGSQTAEYYVLTGNAETVVKTATVAQAATRLGLPVVAATNLSRGATITAKWRMVPLSDPLFPAVEQAGLGVTVRAQIISGAWKLVVDVFQPPTKPRVVSDINGAIRSLSFTREGATASRVIAMANEEGAARVMRLKSIAAREGGYFKDGLAEHTIDTRDTDDTAVIDERIDTALAEAAERTGLRMELAQTATFRYGGPYGVHVGDKVTAEISAGIVRTDVLRECVMTWTSRDGFRAEPQLGTWDGDPLRALPRTLAAAMRQIRALQVNR